MLLLIKLVLQKLYLLVTHSKYFAHKFSAILFHNHCSTSNQVLFADMAFIRFVVIDASTSHMVTQRVIPLKCLRPGYRHVRLRNGSGQPQELSTLFVYTKHEEDLLETRNGADVTGLTVSSFKRMSIFSKVRELSEASKQDSREVRKV